MNDQWRQEKRGDFGWSVEGATEIKAFWLANAVLADPDAKATGKVADSTAEMLKQKVTEHATEITPHANFASAVGSGSLTAFAISEELGGGYLIVFPAGLLSFQVLATESGAPAPATTPQQDSGRPSATPPSAVPAAPTAAPTQAGGLRAWFRRLFSAGPSAK